MNPSFLTHREIEIAARKYGTPLYLYRLDKVAYQFSRLRESLPSRFQIHYALKANSNLVLCRLLAELDCGADVSSYGELKRAIEAGFPPEKILFTGPGKTDEDLSFALKNRVAIIVLESVNEARRLDRLAEQFGVRQGVLVRINPCKTVFNGDIEIASPASKFGIDEESAIGAIAEIQTLENLQINGIQVYTESNVLDYRHLLQSWSDTLTIADRFRAAGLPIERVDFGGGMGVPYERSGDEFAIEQFGKAVQFLLEKNSYPYNYILEIGRYLVAESGYYITEVIDIKKSRDRTFVILNGGIHQLYRPLLKKANRFLDIIGKEGRGNNPHTFVGPLLTPADTLAEDLQTPEIEIGDLVVIYHCGAYAFNHSLANFSLHFYPVEAVYDRQGDLQLIRNRGTGDDFFMSINSSQNKAIQP